MGLLAGGFFTAGEGGDIIGLTDAQGGDDATGGPASATVQCYDATHGTRFGQCWGDELGSLIYQHDVVTPLSNIGDYQMKWDSFSGAAPTSSSSAEGVWQSLATVDFWVTWTLASGPGDIAGAVTVSIRKGAGPSVLATAIWDGEVILSGKGK